jgi:hypothetical protein
LHPVDRLAYNRVRTSAQNRRYEPTTVSG